jgi:uncharacterized protein with von Willebrand factor type A (vWA) domain
VALRDTISRLFGRGGRTPQLGRQSVEHDSIDKMVYDDHKFESARFRRVVLDHPPIITPDAQEPDPLDFSQASPEEIKAWQDQVKAARDARDKADPYTNWEPLTRDLFYAYHHQRPPSIADTDSLDPSIADHAKIMSAWTAQDNFGEARNQTRDNGMMSSMAVMAGIRDFREKAEHILSDRLRQSQEMQEAMNEARERMDELESLREKAREMTEQGQPVPQGLVDKIKQAVADKRAAQQAAAQQAQATPPAMTEELYEAIVAAAGAAHEAAKSAGNVPSFGQGFGQGEPVYESPEQALAIAEKWSKGELAKIAERYGRMFSDFHFKRAKRVVGGQDEIVDIETGDELRRVTPAELALLGDEDLEDDFYARYSSKELLVYSTVGEEHAGRGPMILVVDGSGSMSGERNIWARALALTMLNVARREKRDFAFVEFSSATEVVAFEFPHRKTLEAERIIEMASHFFGGGTAPIIGVATAAKIMDDAAEFKKADIVLVGDGNAGFGAEDKRLRDHLEQKGVRIHPIGIGGAYGYLAKYGTEDPINIFDYELDDPNEATSQLAVSIT